MNQSSPAGGPLEMIEADAPVCVDGVCALPPVEHDDLVAEFGTTGTAG